MKIVIIGAGYAGTVAANRLARKLRDGQVTLVNPRPDFVERIRLHQLIAGTGGRGRSLSSVLHNRVHLKIDEVVEIGDGRVALDGGDELSFDRLVYAAGGSNVAPDGALAVGGVDSARVAAQRLAGLGAGETVDVVGGGLTGIETAAEVATVRPDLAVRLVSESPIGFSLGEAARDRIAERLDRLGVRVQVGFRAEPSSNLTLWAVASPVSDLAARSGLPVDAEGRVVVDEYLRSVGDTRVYAAGDAAAVPGSRQSCQAALPQGAYVADCIAVEAEGGRLRPFSMGFVGQNVSLGRRDGVIQHARRDDVPTRLWFGGRAAAAVKEQVCRGTVWSARSGIGLSLPGAK